MVEVQPKTNTDSKTPSFTKIFPKEKDSAKVTSPAAKPQLLGRYQKIPLPLPPKIQILPKPAKPLYKPIAPKTTTMESTTPSISSVVAHNTTVLPASMDVMSSFPNLPLNNTGLVYAKQKLKQSIEQNGNKQLSDMLDGHVSLVSGSGANQKKYKNIVLDMYHTPSNNNTPIQYKTSNNNTTEGNCNNNNDKRKMTDDETLDLNDPKRQKFLERNRAAASRCRQKRKVWVNQLETKSDNLLKTNTLLLNEITSLRSEVLQLKSLLLAHKDCPVTKQQKQLLGQMTPGSYIAAVSDGQIIAIHQIPDASGVGGLMTTATLTSATTATTTNLALSSSVLKNTTKPVAKTAEELASSALTDMATRATNELVSGTASSSTTTTAINLQNILSTGSLTGTPTVVNLQNLQHILPSGSSSTAGGLVNLQSSSNAVSGC